MDAKATPPRYSFIKRFGITDDTCATFLGEDFGDNFGFADPTSENKLQAFVGSRMCHYCEWNGDCDWLPTRSVSAPSGPPSRTVGGGIGVAKTYSVDEFERWRRENIMKSVRSRTSRMLSRELSCCVQQLRWGCHPVSTHLNTISHVIVIAGWGRTNEGLDYWVGRNSYGIVGEKDRWWLVPIAARQQHFEYGRAGCMGNSAAKDVAAVMGQPGSIVYWHKVHANSSLESDPRADSYCVWWYDLCSSGYCGLWLDILD